jgi:hypothetical protein
MSGDQAGAASALKTALGGVDVGSMNAFQKQALTQATGMDVSALMGLQQGKGGGLTGDLAAEKNKGKAFAEGALQADIGGAAAKLALEQKQREKLLAFEQRQRMIMLQLEQAQRLDGIFLEQKYRALAASKDYEQNKQTMAAEMQAEVASGFAVNLASGNASSLNRAGLDANAQKSFSASAKGADNSLVGMINSGVIKGTDMRLAEYLTQKDDILSSAGKKNKDGSVNDEKAIAQKLADAMTKSFGAEMTLYNAEVKKQTDIRNAQIKTFQAIADAQGKIDSHKDKYGNSQRGDATREEIGALAKATENAKKQYPELFKNFEKHVGGNVNNYKSGKDTEFINGLKGAIPAPLDVKGVQTGNKPMVDAFKTNAEKQIITTANGISIQKDELSESLYSIKLQKEMVALLGLSAQALNLIFENTKKENSVLTLNGRTLTQSLLNQSRTNYGVARTP